MTKARDRASADFNGEEIIIDADADTSITADTDDQIDFKIAGADDFRMTANSFNVLSGSTLTIDSGATITNSGTANGFGGGTIVKIAADEITALVSGSGTFQNTGLEVSITPASTSNKILLLTTGSVGLSHSGAAFRFTQDGTAVGIGDTPGSNTNRPRTSFKVFIDNLNFSQNFVGSCILSPNSTSALTYRVQIEASEDQTWKIGESWNASNSSDAGHAVTSTYFYAIELDGSNTTIST